MAIRWPDGVVTCPTCGSRERHLPGERQRRCKCYEKHPRRSSRSRSGPCLRIRRFGFEKWLPALWLLTNCKNGISSYELARALGVTQKTAWFMLSRLRLALQDEGRRQARRRSRSRRNLHRRQGAQHAQRRSAKRLGITRGRSIAGKVAVMGLLERHGKDGSSQVRTAESRAAASATLQATSREHVEAGATVYTDAFSSYQRSGRAITSTTSSTNRITNNRLQITKHQRSRHYEGSSRRTGSLWSLGFLRCVLICVLHNRRQNRLQLRRFTH